MSCRTPKLIAILTSILILAGCQPTRPTYLHDTGDMSYYIDQATAIEYPDLASDMLDEVVQSGPPITNSQANFESFWDLTLEDAVAIALQNSKIIRGYGTPALQGIQVAPGLDNLSNGPQGAGTMYEVAIRESEPGLIGTPGQLLPPGQISTNTALDANQGVEAALADFDAQLTSSLNWSRSDQPRNVAGTGLIFTPDVFQQDLVTWQTELAKRTAAGTQLLFRTVNSYNANTIPDTVQPLASVYQTALEAEIRQPLARGRGTFINRVPIVISRINADQEIANFESQIQNMVTNIEIRYWELHCAYRILETAKDGRDASLQTWRNVNENFKAGKVPLQDESQAKGQLFFFRAQVQRAWAELLIAESNLRWLLGVASSDTRLIRPTDEPTVAKINFDWRSMMDEALTFRPELRLERWEVKKRELGLAYAKNSLLPNVNASFLYRWLGLGDRYTNYNSDVPLFPTAESGAVNELFDGRYQELSLGLDFGMPIGFRRELSNVRNAQLKLARELARLEDMELDVSREMTQSLQALDANYILAQTNFNGWAAYSEELEARETRYEAGTDPINFLLDAQRSRAQGEASYYQAVCEYNKIISLIHRRKGTILSYNNICLNEGPWPNKAYGDAEENARRRGAARHVNYGFSRPNVISQGGGFGGDAGVEYYEGEGLPNEQFPMPSGDTIYQAPLEEIPSQAVPTPAEGGDQNTLPLPQGGQTQGGQPQGGQPQGGQPQGGQVNPGNTSLHQGARRVIHPQMVTATQNTNQSAQPRKRSAKVNWRRFGMTNPDGQSPNTKAVIRQVNYEEVDK